MKLAQDQFLTGTTGIVFNSKDEILLFKHTYRQDMWSLPGGYIKKQIGETARLDITYS